MDENGNILTLNRNGNRVSSVVDPSGRTLTLTYDGNNLLNLVRNEQSGQSWVPHYDGSGNLTQIDWPSINGTTPYMTLSYDGNRNLNGIHDLNGQYSWAAGYDGGSRLTSQIDAYNNNTLYDYTSGTKVTDANNQSTTYVYAGATLYSVMDPRNYTDYYSYDSYNTLKKHTDRRVKAWSYGIDPKHGNMTMSTDPIGNSSSSVYDARNSKTLQTTDANSHSTTFVYDSSGINLQSTTDALGHTSTVNAYWYGLPTSVSDALGHTSTMSYDGDGNVVQTTDANGNSATATYNRAGWKLTSTDGLGQTVGSRYDAWGRVTSVNTLPTMGVPFYKLVTTDGQHSCETANQNEYTSAQQNGWVAQAPVGGIFQNSADMPGLVPLYRLRENGSGDRCYTTDTNLRSTAINSWGYIDEGIAGYVMPGPAAGFKPLYHLNYPGSRDYYTDDVNEYNSLPAPWAKNGIVCYIYNNTVSTTYDNNSNVLTATDQNGHTTTNTYDIDNRLRTTTKANGDQVVYGYDANGYQGLLSSKTDGNGNAILYRYSVRSEMNEIDYPDGTKENFAYDENGDLKQHTKRDNTPIVYDYDNDSRLWHTYYPAGGITQNVTLAYYANGLQLTMADGTGTTTWTYDAADRLYQMSAPGGAVSYGYDDANRRTSMTQGGHTTSYYYDNAGRMQTLDNGLGNVFDFTYDNGNRLRVRNNRQGVGTAYTYNSAGLVTNILSNQNGGSGTTLNTDGYTYDPAGNRLTSNSYDGYTAYTYDAADQITGENHNAGYPSFTATYDYDHNGNRLHKTQNGQTDMYTYQANAYNSALHTDELQKVSGGLTGTKTYGYDTNGVANKITTNGTPLYLTADAEDRYTRFDFNTGPGTGSVYSTETYNGAGLRTFRHSADGLNHSLAYGGTSPGDALLSDSNASTLYTPGLVQQDTNGQHFFQLDALGSVRGFTGNTQAPQGEVYYDAFGLPSVRQGSQPFPLGFAGAAGYQTDSDTGLMLLGNRYYDPSIGRFLSPDPSGDGDNWYAYCDNEPLTRTDPTGLTPLTAPMGGSFGNPGGDQFNAILADNGFDNPNFFDENIQMAAKSSAAKEAKAAATNILTAGDSFLFYGKGKAFATTMAAYKAGRASWSDVLKAGGVLTLAVGINFIPGEEVASLAVRGILRVTEGRVISKAIADPLFHNFSPLLDEFVYKGVKTVVSPQYTLYRAEGFFGKHAGTFQIGVRPIAPGLEAITHRVFIPH